MLAGGHPPCCTPHIYQEQEELGMTNPHFTRTERYTWEEPQLLYISRGSSGQDRWIIISSRDDNAPDAVGRARTPFYHWYAVDRHCRQPSTPPPKWTHRIPSAAFTNAGGPKKTPVIGAKIRFFYFDIVDLRAYLPGVDATAAFGPAGSPRQPAGANCQPARRLDRCLRTAGQPPRHRRRCAL